MQRKHLSFEEFQLTNEVLERMLNEPSGKGAVTFVFSERRIIEINIHLSREPYTDAEQAVIRENVGRLRSQIRQLAGTYVSQGIDAYDLYAVIIQKLIETTGVHESSRDILQHAKWIAVTYVNSMSEASRLFTKGKSE